MNQLPEGGGGVPSVYADLYFLMNWIIDLILLYSAARLANHRINISRLVVAACFGALYATVGLWVTEHSDVLLTVLYTPYGKIACSLLMIAMAFFPVNAGRFLTLLLYSYATAALVAGTSIAFSLFGAQTWMNSWMMWQGIPWWGVVVIAGVAGFYLHRLWHWAAERQMREQNIFQVELLGHDSKCVCRGLLDTGHQLRDPVTNQPVIVVELDVLREWLPAVLVQALQTKETDWSKMVEALQDGRWSSRIRILPFRSLGSSHGVLVGIRVDRLRLVNHQADDRHFVEWHGVTAAIYPERLTGDGHYHALLHPDLLRGKSELMSQPAVP